MRTKKQKKASRKWAENRRNGRAALYRSKHRSADMGLGLSPMHFAQAMMAAFSGGMRKLGGGRSS